MRAKATAALTALPRSERSFCGLSFSGALALLAVVAVLIVVSVPRLRGLALEENEADARATAASLARALPAPGAARGRPPSLRGLLANPVLAGVRADGELLLGGTLLRRHGYLFELAPLPPLLRLPAAPLALLSGDRGALRDQLAIRAWPWAHGTTGEAAFLATRSGVVLRHENDSPCREGLEGAGASSADVTGWR